MAIPTVMGSEIEYGITLRNDPDFDPIAGCVLLVNAYREDPTGEVPLGLRTGKSLGGCAWVPGGRREVHAEPAGKYRSQQDSGKRSAVLRRPRAS